jgi:hypothetical protein
MRNEEANSEPSSALVYLSLEEEQSARKVNPAPSARLLVPIWQTLTRKHFA